MRHGVGEPLHIAQGAVEIGGPFPHPLLELKIEALEFALRSAQVLDDPDARRAGDQVQHRGQKVAWVGRKPFAGGGKHQNAGQRAAHQSQ